MRVENLFRRGRMTRISRFVAIVLALFSILGAPFAAGQDKSITVLGAASMKNALDERPCGIHEKHRHQGSCELCRKLGFNETDRAGSTGRCFRLSRPRLDGLRLGEKARQ